MVARDLLKRSLRKIGVLASGESMDADTSADALEVLNSMLGNWATNGLLVSKVTRETFALTSGQQLRTIGSGGNFSTSRPMDISNASILVGSSEYPVDLLTAEQWAGIVDKSVTSDIPSAIYYEPDYPLGKLYFWPVPSAANSVILQTRKPFSTLLIGDTISFPPGYDAAIVPNLSILLAPEFGKEPSATLINEARTTKADIMRQNSTPELMESDLAPGKPYNINTGP